MSEDKLWLRLRQYVDGAKTLEAVLAQLLEAAVELEELAQTGYVLEGPVEVDGLRLARLSEQATPGGADATRVPGSETTPGPHQHAI